jgi:hypothetical protein
MIRAFNKIKGAIIDASIMMNGQLIIFPEMIKAVINEIIMNNKIIGFKRGEYNSNKMGQKYRIDPLNESRLNASNLNSSRQTLKPSDKHKVREFLWNEKYDENNRHKRHIRVHLFMQHIGLAASSFVSKDNAIAEN